VALRRAGADGLTVGLLAASLLFANHPMPSGTVGMLALFAAAWRWDRQRGKVCTPVAAPAPAPAIPVP
jgi:hypothetical protein